MERAFSNFLQALRGAEVRVSAAEALDAMQVMDLVGWSDRETLKASLSFALAKSEQEKDAFAACFEDFYRVDTFRHSSGEDGAAAPAASRLGQLLRANDQAGLALELEQAAAATGVENIRYFTQRGLYARRIMEQMGLVELDKEINALAAQGSGGAGGATGSGGSGTGSGGENSTRETLETGRAYLLEQVRDFVEQQLALQATAMSRSLKEDRLRRSRIGNIARRDQEAMAKIIERIAKRLLTLYSRKPRLKDRGLLDVRHTLRRNYGNDGLLVELRWRKRKIERPKVVAICDVSGSVAQVARFLLQFLYALHEVLTDIKTFAFSGRLIETSQFFEHLPVEAAVDEVMARVGNMSTDYGQSLADFRAGWLDRIDRRTTVIVLGDARSNHTEPRADIMKEIFERSKRVIWLNPEAPSLWNSGDSEQRRYAPYCHLVRECNTLNHLERLVEQLLESAYRIR